MPEREMRDRLEMIEKHSHGRFAYNESAALQQLIKQKSCSQQDLIRFIFQPEN
jgi:hypothetical protein